jgi:hypothetical protein
MIFAPFDAADISALRNVKTVFKVSKNDFVRTKIIGISDNPVLIRDIACTSFVKSPHGIRITQNDNEQF